MSVPIDQAGLDEAHLRRRERIDAWIDERARATKPKDKTELEATRERLLAQAANEAAATLVNRLVLLRHLEALGLSKPVVVTGGWSSKGYREFREFAPTLCTNGTTDATEGYATLLQLLFDELALELPGLFGDVGLTRLFQIPAATLREVIERLDDVELTSAWTDDTTLGWVYQFWNDFERDALDAKALRGEKIEPHEIASKTQMFTDRYIVEWLLQNSLGVTWLAMCKRRGWTADAERVLPLLETRRAEWRRRRDSGEVALDALMPIEGDLEERWKYYVAQPISDDAVEQAPESVRAIKILDPACGSGHFLVIAFGLLVALYREEATHTRAKITDEQIAESILENNLHGIDIDPRATQIAAAGLYLKAKALAKTARPRELNIVAPILQLGALPADDPAVVLLRKDLKNQVGIPEELTTKLLNSLAGVDYLGSLLKVDAAVEDAIKNVELELERAHGQGNLFGGFPAHQVKLSVVEAKATILDKLEQFLSKHSKSEDLGLRLDGEQVAAGVRFIRIARTGAYDLVVGNPPYLGLGKTESLGYVARTYPTARPDLYAAFVERAVDLARQGGMLALVTMRNWMFLGQFTDFRKHLLSNYEVWSIGDLDRGAFESMVTSQLISVAMLVLCKRPPRLSSGRRAAALQPTAPGEKYWGADRTELKRAAVLVQRGRFDFDAQGFDQIAGSPILYWWNPKKLAALSGRPLLGKIAKVVTGLQTSRDARFLRRPWEVRFSLRTSGGEAKWAPLVANASGKKWMEPVDDLVRWQHQGFEIRVFPKSYPRNVECYFLGGVAFADTGAVFAARLHRIPSVIGDKGPSVLCANETDSADVLCAMNRSEARALLESLNPGTDFQVGDVERLPVVFVPGADHIVRVLRTAFDEHEKTREPSVEFRRPGPSSWTSAVQWADAAIDRDIDAPLAKYVPTYEGPSPAAALSFSIGVSLGRLGADGEGVLDAPPPTALPAGILFVSIDAQDTLEHPACLNISRTWREQGTSVPSSPDLRTFLRKSFFEAHNKMYEKRPIYFPLSSTKKSFVAFVSIHLWADDTLNVLLADHLVPAKRRFEGEVEDLRVARVSGNNKGKAEKRFTDVQKLLEELNDFIAKVVEVAEKGPPPSDDKTEERHADARFLMDLDDGVMVNSAALWPLLEPQWKEPKKWWKELANATGKTDYDWSRLAARYFPDRVGTKCQGDPSLAIAHKRFWELHAAKAYAWELRLKDEIRPDFTIDEPTSNEARAKFLKEHDREAREILSKEIKRREKKLSRADDEGDTGPLFDNADAQNVGAIDA